MAINFSAQFIVNEKTSTRVLRLTDTSTGFTLSKGNFIITFPDGTQVANTDFANPQITAPGGNTSVSLITDVDNTVLTGTYVITYVALNTSLNEFTKTETFDFNWEKPAKAIINDSDVVLPEVQFKDLTAYETSGSFAGTLTRNFYTTTPSTSEVGVITKTSVGDILTPVNASKYYEGIYLVKSDISVAYTHTSKSWLTVAYTDLLEETFDVREAPTQDELVALMNTYKDQIEAYKSTNPSQYEIMNEQYDLVLALYSHILARYQTSTLDGSKAILDQLLGLLPPASSYTYKATQMLPFTINFSTSLTGSGTTGTIPKFTGTASIGDSIIKEDTNRIGIGKTPTTTLDVNGTIQGTSIVKSGGLSSQFLKADGSIDANAYLTTGSAASTYQPLDADLTAIATLAGAAGILTKVSANTWTLDTTSYQTLDADLTAIAALSGTTGLLKKTDANTWVLDTSVYLTGITSSQITTALGYTPENAANKGVNNGYAGLDSTGKVPSTQLPSYVDDVIEAANLAALPATGETGKIYVTLDTNKIYRWTGSIYVEVSPSVGTVWGGITGTLANQTDLQSALDAKQGTLTLTTTGTSGAATLVGSTLNVPVYQGGVTSFNTRTGAITLSSTDVTNALTYIPYPTPTGNTTQYIAGDGSLVTFPTVGTAGTLTREVRNTTGATLTKGTVVYISGATGNKPTVSKAIATGDSTSAQTFGLVQADIAHNAIGNVICVGDLTGLNTLGIPEGTQLYLSSTTAGAYTTTKQLAPAHLVYIGIVTREHATLGQIEVNIQNGYELYELHDVSVGSYGTNDVLYRDTTTNLWKNASIATILGYTPQPAFASGTGFVKISGTTISYVNETYLTTAGAAAQYQPIGTYATGSGEATRLARWTSIENLSVAQIWDDGTNIGIGQAAGAFKLDVTGTLRVTGAATFGSSVTATSFIKTSGTSSQFLKADGSVDSSTYLTTAGAAAQYQVIGSYVSGSGVSTRLARWISPTDLSVSVIYDDGTNIGIGQAPGAFKLDVTGTMRVTGAATFGSSVTATSFVITSGTSLQFLKADGSVDSNTYLTTAGAAAQYQPIGTYSTGSGESSRLARWTSTSNLSVAQIWDDGTNIGIGQTPGAFKLDVTGTQRVTGAATFGSSVTATSFVKTSGTSAQFLKADGSVDSSTYLTTTSAAAQYQPIGSYAGGSGSSSRLARWISSTDLSVAQIWDDGTNIGIGQAPGAFKLDVTGTMRVTGAATFSSSVTATALSLSNTDGYLGTINSSGANGGYFEWRTSGTTIADIGTLAQIFGSGGSTNFGINARGARDLAFGTNNTERLRITSGGNVGIGTTSPYALLSVYGGSAGDRILIDSNSGTGSNGAIAWGAGGVPNISARIKGTDDGAYGTHLIFETRGNGASGTTTTERMRITSGGDVIVGNGTQSVSLAIDRGSSSGSNGLRFRTAGTNNWYVGSGGTGTNTNFEIYNHNTATANLIINYSNGNVGIGTTNPAATRLYVVAATSSHGLRIETDANYNALSIGGSGNISVDYPGIGGGRFLLNNDGALVIRSTMTASSFFESSDKNLKTLIEDNYQAKGIESVTAKLYLKNGVEELGYYAQDVQGILPSAVTTGTDGFLNLSYREVHTAKIARLEKRVEELEAQLNLV